MAASFLQTKSSAATYTGHASISSAPDTHSVVNSLVGSSSNRSIRTAAAVRESADALMGFRWGSGTSRSRQRFASASAASRERESRRLRGSMAADLDSQQTSSSIFGEVNLQGFAAAMWALPAVDPLTNTTTICSTVDAGVAEALFPPREPLQLNVLLQQDSVEVTVGKVMSEQLLDMYSQRLRQLHALAVLQPEVYRRSKGLEEALKIYTDSVNILKQLTADAPLGTGALRGILLLLRLQQGDVVRHLIHGVREFVRTDASINRKHQAALFSVCDRFLESFFACRVSAELLRECCLGVLEGWNVDGSPVQCSSVDMLASRAAMNARRMAVSSMGLTPTIRLFVSSVSARQPQQHGVTSRCAAANVYSGCFELIKNALEATVRAGKQQQQQQQEEKEQWDSIRVCQSVLILYLPAVSQDPELINPQRLSPVDVHLIRCLGGGVLIKVHDEGSGLGQTEQQLAWRFLYSTRDYKPPKLQSESTLLSGWGVGLPLTRIYARAFGGEAFMESRRGLGTSCYLFINNIQPSTNEIMSTGGDASGRTAVSLFLSQHTLL